MSKWPTPTCCSSCSTCTRRSAPDWWNASWFFPPTTSYFKASHAFNLLDARGVISVTERAHYIGRVRTLSRLCAEGYVALREKMGFPLLKE
ncbi:MAG: glycine--tRNA ligase subunit alpha [Syntrophotaleaceae bacterium]